MNQYPPFAHDESEIVAPHGSVNRSDWRLLRRLQIPDKFNDPDGGFVKRGLVVDVETTGLSLESDEVIQLGMLPFEYDSVSGKILAIDNSAAFEEFREPSVEISEEITLITGITPEDVRGESVDDDAVAEIVGRADLVIAHNAFFDRAMIEKHWACFADAAWSCTLNSVDWRKEGFSAGKLDYLGMQFGWFFDGHNALADCEACLALLAQTLPNSNQRVMAAVREAALQSDYLVPAFGAPYERAKVMKQRGYRWRPEGLQNGKVWWKITSDPETEVAWLQNEVYGGKSNVSVEEVTAFNRFSERIWDFG
jgi:DNA polymerase III subunit epsilon